LMSIMNSSDQLRMTVYASLMAALIAVGAWISIPIGPVPIYLGNFFVFLSGLLLGKRWGLMSVSVYLLAGICGLPVFSGGTGGLGRIIGPTGGYLIGYIPAVFVIGFVSEIKPGNKTYEIFGTICGALLIYAFGVPQLKYVMGMSYKAAVIAGMNPLFIIGDAVKIAAAVAAAGYLQANQNKAS